MPRKNLPKDVKRDVRFNVYANDEEAEIIRQKAKESGMSPTDYLRKAGINKHLKMSVPKVNLEKWQELGKLVKTLNDVIDAPENFLDQKIDVSFLHHIRFEVQQLRLELLSNSTNN